MSEDVPVSNKRPGRPRVYITPSVLKSALEAGATVADIAKTHNCHVKTVYRAIESSGLKDFLTTRYSISKETLERLYPEKTEREVAEELGCSTTTVHRALVKYGINRVRKAPQGERSSRSKHTEAMVRLVRESAAKNVPVSKIAELTGIPLQTLYKIIRRKTWRHLP